MATNSNDGEILYGPRKIPGHPIRVSIIAYPDRPHYTDPILNEKHRRIEFEIQELHILNGIDKGMWVKNSVAFSIEDQKALWRAVIKNIVYAGEKKRKVQILRNLANELEQIPLNLDKEA